VLSWQGCVVEIETREDQGVMRVSLQLPLESMSIVTSGEKERKGVLRLRTAPSLPIWPTLSPGSSPSRCRSMNDRGKDG